MKEETDTMRDYHREPNDTRRSATDADPIVAPGREPLTAGLVGKGPVLESGLVQRKAERDDNGVAADADEHLARAASGTGAPLPDLLRAQFEGSLGADLSGVRVHTDATSQAAAQSVGARAYTVGNDIHFNAGQFDPSSSGGQHLLAHEVAHTVQQRGGAGVQHKLEVGRVDDPLESEADSAADAMVTGAPAHVSASGVIGRKVQREELPPIEIHGGVEDTSIKDDMNQAAADSQNADSKKYSWGSDSLKTKDEHGKDVENDKNPLVANAKRNGSIEKLRQLSSELDIVKPPLVAWKSAHAQAEAAGGHAGINPNTPQAYKNDFKRMKTELDKGETGPMGKVLSSLRAAQQARQKTALLGLKSAVKSLESAKAKYQQHKIYLEQLKTKEEVAKNAAALAVVNSQIADCVKAITYTAKAVSILAGGIGALEAGSVTLMDNDPNSGVDIKGQPALPAGIGSGADKVAGAEGVLTKFFEYTLFKGELDQIKATEASLNAKASSLAAAMVTQQTVSAGADLDAAASKADEAKQNKEDADREFHNALIQAGRNFDQRKMTDAQKEKDTVDAKAHVKGENSMEGLMAVYSAMVKRGQSRSAFLKAAEGCPTLNLGSAKAIVDQVMDSGKMAKDDFAKTDIDHPDNAGASGVDHIIAGSIGNQMKQGIAMALSHIEVAKKNDAFETSIEQQWDSLVAMGTSGLIAGQV
jgi:hypothetical protein